MRAAGTIWRARSLLLSASKSPQAALVAAELERLADGLVADNGERPALRLTRRKEAA